MGLCDSHCAYEKTESNERGSWTWPNGSERGHRYSDGSAWWSQRRLRYQTICTHGPALSIPAWGQTSWCFSFLSYKIGIVILAPRRIAWGQGYVIFIHIFLIAGEVDSFFTHLLAIQISSSVNFLFNGCCPVFFFFFLIKLQKILWLVDIPVFLCATVFHHHLPFDNVFGIYHSCRQRPDVSDWWRQWEHRLFAQQVHTACQSSVGCLSS